jgi:membrane fusion protein (multidrug efflux system)
VVILAMTILISLTRNWNAWEGGKVEQVTDDAYVRGDLTPLSTKVPGIVCAVHVEDFQQIHAKALLLQSQLDYSEAHDEFIHAMGRTPE